jgi:very-short-patch-repair endonuclease
MKYRESEEFQWFLKSIEAWMARKQARPPQKSRDRSPMNEMIADLLSYLDKEKITYFREYRVLTRFCDIAFPDKRFVLEGDGSSHHLRVDAGMTLTTVTRMRNLFLLLEGWGLVELALPEWEKARTTGLVAMLMRETVSRIEETGSDRAYIFPFFKHVPK